ncbi:DUF3307 domain-containing protein [Pedobacter arcticus]|uniref:DUF3307 domain-containing protein n=1 Tax=Pedobacter arcticus TaxID=752140 RepID=UPI0003822E46|nr:DUF3307 domain-containing protein [Pedobacter arcticus]
MFELILKITLAHLLGDFVFQTNKMVQDIQDKKFRSLYLYAHIVIHLLLILIATGFDKKYIIASIILALSHFAIDVITKVFLKNSISTISNFLLDQFLHVIAIAVFIKHFYNYNIDLNQIFSNQNYLLVIALISLTYVSSILIKKIIEIFNYPLPNGGLKNAGKYIGMLERLFVFGFIVTSFWEGIGFLLAAKSIFRFGDLKENKDIKLTEYILIGTLLSFGVAILIGLLYLKIKVIL